MIVFSEMVAEIDTWYFIELYHFNVESQESVKLYVNSSLVQVAPGKMYPYLLQYDENTIGCETQLHSLGRQSKDETVSNFCGTMSALYFLSVNAKELQDTHLFLSYIREHPNFLDHFSFHLSNKKSHLELISKVFLLINPKYTKKFNQDKQKVLTVKVNSKDLDIYNTVEQLHKGVKAYQKISPEENFLNLGDIRLLLPCLYNLLKHGASQSLMYI